MLEKTKQIIIISYDNISLYKFDASALGMIVVAAKKFTWVLRDGMPQFTQLLGSSTLVN